MPSESHYTVISYCTIHVFLESRMECNFFVVFNICMTITHFCQLCMMRKSAALNTKNVHTVQAFTLLNSVLIITIGIMKNKTNYNSKKLKLKLKNIFLTWNYLMQLLFRTTSSLALAGEFHLDMKHHLIGDVKVYKPIRLFRNNETHIECDNYS